MAKKKTTDRIKVIRDELDAIEAELGVEPTISAAKRPAAKKTAGVGRTTAPKSSAKGSGTTKKPAVKKTPVAPVANATVKPAKKPAAKKSAVRPDSSEELTEARSNIARATGAVAKKKEETVKKAAEEAEEVKTERAAEELAEAKKDLKEAISEFEKANWINWIYEITAPLDERKAYLDVVDSYETYVKDNQETWLSSNDVWEVRASTTLVREYTGKIEELKEALEQGKIFEAIKEMEEEREKGKFVDADTQKMIRQVLRGDREHYDDLASKEVAKKDLKDAISKLGEARKTVEINATRDEKMAFYDAIKSYETYVKDNQRKWLASNDVSEVRTSTTLVREYTGKIEKLKEALKQGKIFEAIKEMEEERERGVDIERGSIKPVAEPESRVASPVDTATVSEKDFRDTNIRNYSTLHQFVEDAVRDKGFTSRELEEMDKRGSKYVENQRRERRAAEAHRRAEKVKAERAAAAKPESPEDLAEARSRFARAISAVARDREAGREERAKRRAAEAHRRAEEVREERAAAAAAAAEAARRAVTVTAEREIAPSDPTKPMFAVLVNGTMSDYSASYGAVKGKGALDSGDGVSAKVKVGLRAQARETNKIAERTRASHETAGLIMAPGPAARDKDGNLIKDAAGNEIHYVDLWVYTPSKPLSTPGIPAPDFKTGKCVVRRDVEKLNADGGVVATESRLVEVDFKDVTLEDMYNTPEYFAKVKKNKLERPMLAKNGYSFTVYDPKNYSRERSIAVMDSSDTIRSFIDLYSRPTEKARTALVGQTIFSSYDKPLEMLDDERDSINRKARFLKSRISILGRAIPTVAVAGVAFFTGLAGGEAIATADYHNRIDDIIAATTQTVIEQVLSNADLAQMIGIRAGSMELANGYSITYAHENDVNTAQQIFSKDENGNIVVDRSKVAKLLTGVVEHTPAMDNVNAIAIGNYTNAANAQESVTVKSFGRLAGGAYGKFCAAQDNTGITTIYYPTEEGKDPTDFNNGVAYFRSLGYENPEQKAQEYADEFNAAATMSYETTLGEIENSIPQEIVTSDESLVGAIENRLDVENITVENINVKDITNDDDEVVGYLYTIYATSADGKCYEMSFNSTTRAQTTEAFVNIYNNAGVEVDTYESTAKVLTEEKKVEKFKSALSNYFETNRNVSIDTSKIYYSVSKLNADTETMEVRLYAVTKDGKFIDMKLADVGGVKSASDALKVAAYANPTLNLTISTGISGAYITNGIDAATIDIFENIGTKESSVEVADEATAEGESVPYSPAPKTASRDELVR